MDTSQENHRKLRFSTLPIRALGCAADAAGIDDVLHKVPGVTRVYLNPVTEMAYIEYDADRCTETTLRSALDRAGYREERSESFAKPRISSHNVLTGFVSAVARTVGVARDRIFHKTPQPRKSP